MGGSLKNRARGFWSVLRRSKAFLAWITQAESLALLGCDKWTAPALGGPHPRRLTATACVSLRFRSAFAHLPPAGQSQHGLPIPATSLFDKYGSLSPLTGSNAYADVTACPPPTPLPRQSLGAQIFNIFPPLPSFRARRSPPPHRRYSPVPSQENFLSQSLYVRSLRPRISAVLSSRPHARAILLFPHRRVDGPRALSRFLLQQKKLSK